MKIRSIINLSKIIFSVILAMTFSNQSQAQDLTFGGYDCLENCSGHAAGYSWAKENRISMEESCDDKSMSFYYGCKAYIDDPDRGSEKDDQGNPIHN